MQKDEAEKILGKRIHFSRLQYLVRWKGEKKNSWEPLSNLKNALDLIEEYENKSQVSDDELVIE